MLPQTPAAAYPTTTQRSTPDRDWKIIITSTNPHNLHPQRRLHTMGNSSSKDERRQAHANANQQSHSSPSSSTRQSPSQQQQTSADRLTASIYAVRNASARGSRHDISFLHLSRGNRDRDINGEAEAAVAERPRETKQEREARRAERERQARLKERERSMAEEHVDGGYLVTLGTYTGSEDFNKVVVRQLMIERKLAPFWKGLEDHSDSWTEAQLFAAARGLRIPAPDEVPPEMARSASQASSIPPNSEMNINNLTVPITSRSQSYQSDRSASLSASHSAFSNASGSSTLTPSNLFRGRAKTLASLATGRSQSSADTAPQEIRLPVDNRINGQQLQVYLYKDATECPICFLYYPPYLNRTRCCDQDICSECFVQIKRPEPHAPEHEQPGQERPPEEEAEMLVSEIASCPFCVTPEFGVTYEPPPFRRGLAYSYQQGGLHSQASAMSSSTSLTSGGPLAGRRRATSVSASSSNVVTTDRVRPDWAKKLADARANALRRSAAATALHNAAYVLGNQGDRQTRTGLIGRRRRTLFESPGASGVSTPREGRTAITYEDFVRNTNTQHQGGDGNEGNGNDIAGRRGSSRRRRVDDLEELMMMEAIRLSLEAEEERKRRDEKEAAREAKKRAKSERKEGKKAEKAERKRGGSAASSTLQYTATNDSGSSTWASTSMARSSSNLAAQPEVIPEGDEQVQGKGKQPAQDFAGFNPLTEPTSVLNRGVSTAASDGKQEESASLSTMTNEATMMMRNEDSPLRFLETTSRHNLPLTSTTAAAASASFHHPSTLSRQLSNLSSVSNVSSTATSSGVSTTGAVDAGMSGAQQHISTTAGSAEGNGGSAGESMFNFGSLTAAMVHHHGDGDGVEGEKGREEGEHIERFETVVPVVPRAVGTQPTLAAGTVVVGGGEGVPVGERVRSRGGTGESSSSAPPPPPVYVEYPIRGAEGYDGRDDDMGGDNVDRIMPARREEEMQRIPSDSKGIVENVRVLGQRDGFDGTTR